MPVVEEVADLDGGAAYPIITGDYTVGARWESTPIHSGRPIATPTPVFTKLDPSIVEDELAQMGV
jgi:methionyl-tRNA synthetase